MLTTPLRRSLNINAGANAIRSAKMSTDSISNSFKIHGVARSGFDAGGSSGLYDRARPTYPIEAISTILREGQQASGAPLRLVELGAGTGICTRMLLTQATCTSSDGTPPPGISSLRAIEPSAGMRAAFEKSVLSSETGLVGQLKQKGQLSPNTEVTIDGGTFEDFDAGNDNDAVVIAQAWHWCRDFDLALKKAAASLRKGGILALIWNLEDREAAPWVAKLRDAYEMYEDNTPQYRHNLWHAMYKTASYHDYFNADEPRLFQRALPTTLEGVKDRVKSKSYVSVLSPSQQAKLDEQMEHIFATHTDEELGRRWIEKEQGVWEYPYRTDLLIFRRK